MRHFVVILNLQVPREEIGPRRLELHDNHFRSGYEIGLFLFYGPLNPPNGYLAIARSKSSCNMANFLAEDPLVVDHLASVMILDYQPVWFPESLRGWVHPLDFNLGHSSDGCPTAYI
jgi:hypothetical protein